MQLATFEELPSLSTHMGDVEVVTAGDCCLVRTRNWLALCSLSTGRVDWRVDRNAPCVNENGRAATHCSDMNLWGAKLWIHLEAAVIAELFLGEPDSLLLVARCLQSGRLLWQQSYPRPSLAPWAEASPAWPGAPQEEIYAFLARSQTSIVLCIYRQTRCMGLSTPEWRVMDRPPFHCQTDFLSFEPQSGQLRWSQSVAELRLDVLDWKDFYGLWVHREQAGWIDLESGVVACLSKTGSCFGRPANIGELGYFPWFDAERKSIGSIQANRHMEIEHEAAWTESGVREIVAWPTQRGMALQVNSQKVIWTVGTERLWDQRARPYIYRAFASDISDVFVATDGNGGRLYGYDPTSGNETFNFRPVLGGLGNTRFFGDEKLAIGSVAMKKSHFAPPQLFIFQVETQEMKFLADCWMILGNWQHGVVFVTGSTECRRLAVLKFMA